MKLADFTGWIKHDGLGCPLAVGTLVRTRWPDGTEIDDVVDADALRTEPWLASDGVGLCFNGWAWAVNGRPEECCHVDIIEYIVTGLPAEEAYEDNLVRVPVAVDA
jgi:hypothetical protein